MENKTYYHMGNNKTFRQWITEQRITGSDRVTLRNKQNGVLNAISYHIKDLKDYYDNTILKWSKNYIGDGSYIYTVYVE